jgi:hypothetical protein
LVLKDFGLKIFELKLAEYDNSKSRFGSVCAEGVVAHFHNYFSPIVILSAAAAGRGTLRRPVLLMRWTGAPALHAVTVSLASAQPMAWVS